MSESNEPDIMYHGAEWFEKNKGKLLYGALAVIIAAGGIQFYRKDTAQTKAASESALFAITESIQNRDATNLEDIAGAYRTVSIDQAGKPVAERALILSAKTWLEAADYDKAQAAFKSYLAQHADGVFDGFWADEAKLGQAICQEVNGDAAAAIITYQSLTNNERLQELQIALLDAEDEAEREPIERELKRLRDEPPAAIQNRATALLEAAQTNLEPLEAKPKPAPVLQPEAPKPEAPKPEAPKPEAPKPEAPKPEAPKPEAPKPEAPAALPAPVAPDNK